MTTVISRESPSDETHLFDSYKKFDLCTHILSICSDFGTTGHRVEITLIFFLKMWCLCSFTEYNKWRYWDPIDQIPVNEKKDWSKLFKCMSTFWLCFNDLVYLHSWWNVICSHLPCKIYT